MAFLVSASMLVRLAIFTPVLGASLLPQFDVTGAAPFFEVWRSHLVENASQSISQDEATDVVFPLVGTQVNASISNGVAHVRVTQQYVNGGADCLHSRYIFPLPARAAVSAMTMMIGNRSVVGEIRTRSDARDEFEAAKDNGQTASLLEQERPNVFAMELANIVPGDEVNVIVEYVETLVPVDGIFAFTFPTVVGPRYGQDWAPGLDTSSLGVDMHLTLAPSCLGLESEQDLAVTDDATVNATHVALSDMDRDIVVKFWFTETSVGAQLLVTQAGSEKYFSLAIQPPQRRLLASEQISQREYLFILDVSGSMTGYPIDLSKALMLQLLRENVREGDKLNILLFAGGSAVFSENNSVEATSENVASAEDWLDVNMYGGGGTELLPALKRAFGLPRDNLASARTIVIMTDGYVSVEREAFDLVRDRMGEGSIFVFGIGDRVNHYLVEGLARVGYGEAFVVTEHSQGSAVVEKLRVYIDSPVLTNLSLAFEGSFEPYALEPPHLPDLYASRPIQVVGKWQGSLSGALRLQGLLADGQTWQFAANIAEVDIVAAPAVRLLWARSRIAVLSDYGSVHGLAVEDITALGLNYSLLTEYTSFVAIDSIQSRPDMCAASEPSSGQSTTYRAWTDGVDLSDGPRNVAFNPCLLYTVLAAGLYRFLM